MVSEWSVSEKKIARRVFDAALQGELAEVLLAFKAMAAAATGSEDMWATEAFLAKARHELDGKYDYRYSQLHVVFGRLLREGRISREALSGLSDEKMLDILRIAAL
jgi:hypothetical protein